MSESNVFGMTLGYRVKGQDDELALQKMSIAFERVGENLDDFGRFLFPKLSKLLETEVAGQFDARGRGPNRGHWAPLTEAYAERKAKQYPGAGILEATGTMADALTSESGAHALRVDSGRQFNFGTSGVPYASLHQTGTDRMTDRPIFDFSRELEEGIQREGREAAREAIREAGVEEFATVGDR